MVNFSEMTAPQLLGILDTYPWFTAARAALCRKTGMEAGREAEQEVLRDCLPFFPYNSVPVLNFMTFDPDQFKDSSLAAEAAPQGPSGRKVFVAGMDYFSKEDYESARYDIDARLSRIAMVDYSTPAPEAIQREEEQYDFVTETLAEIYAEQGYIDQAISIYNKLSLQSPEKNAYFASLIDKLKN